MDSARRLPRGRILAEAAADRRQSVAGAVSPRRPARPGPFDPLGDRTRAARLELEITEGVLIDDFSRAVSILRRLKALGVRIAMDDFGTGYSSLSYLQAFPFDKIKIDQRFISNLDTTPSRRRSCAPSSGWRAASTLRWWPKASRPRSSSRSWPRRNCDQVQGYLIGRPAPIEHYAELVGRMGQTRRRLFRCVGTTWRDPIEPQARGGKAATAATASASHAAIKMIPPAGAAKGNKR